MNDTMVSIIDYAENYSFKVQSEVQSMHWYSYQVTILVHIMWVRNSNPDPEDESTRSIMTYHFYIFVYCCIGIVWSELVLPLEIIGFG
jgi:hypothetical protein